MNQKWGVQVSNTTWADGRLMSQYNHLTGSGFQILLWIRDEGRWGNKVKKTLILQISPRMASLRQGYVLISSFLPSTGGQSSEQRHFNSQAEGQDSLRQALMRDYSNKSYREQVKDTVPTWSQNWLIPEHPKMQGLLRPSHCPSPPPVPSTTHTLLWVCLYCMFLVNGLI